MALGAGKYDDVCTIVREKTDGAFVAVIVFGGNKGSGYSCQMTNLESLQHVPDILEDLARQIREDACSTRTSSGF